MIVVLFQGVGRGELGLSHTVILLISVSKILRSAAVKFAFVPT